MKFKNSTYGFYREIYKEHSVNCYTGSICEIFKINNHPIDEYILWTVGRGFQFTEGVDEYGDPQIAFDLFRTVDRFCEKYGCKLKMHELNIKNIPTQIATALENDYLMVWANSKYLQYSDLYYSLSGYLHAIVLENIVADSALVRVRDSLIVSNPAVSCIADLPMEMLEKALIDKVRTPEFDVMGKYITIHLGQPLNQFTKNDLAKYLLQNAMDILEEYQQNGSIIIKYFNRCKKEISSNDNSRIFWVLRRITNNVKTLYIMPNRLLLYKLFEALGMNDLAYERLIVSLNYVMLKWKTIANFCLKCSLKGDFEGVDQMEHYFLEVDKAENKFWELTTENLRRYLF